MPDSNSVFRRTRKRKNFTTLSNAFIQNPAMTLEARGLLALMLSLPEDWIFRFNWLAKQAPHLGRFRLRRILKEVGDFGYLQYRKKQNPQGRFIWEYEITEIPFDFAPEVTQPPMADPPTVDPPVVNQPTYKEPIIENTNRTNITEAKKAEATTTTNKRNGGDGGRPLLPSADKENIRKAEAPIIEALKDFLAKECEGNFTRNSPMVIRTARCLGSRAASIAEFKALYQDKINYMERYQITLNQVRDMFAIDGQTVGDYFDYQAYTGE